ncbi:uncharacterized protein V1518DRAFT_412008 [Limtongia smithiae]|uniref:uncharacterized protein n=1 Tax=Limtongia smithiae TaxID=1125753 RepID=UPI0034CE7A3C
MDDFTAMAPSNVSFDFADCEDFLARLEAEESTASSYQTSLNPSLSPEDLLSSGHGSSPLSSFSPHSDDPNDPNSWRADQFLFPIDTANSLVLPQDDIKPEVNTVVDPSQFFFEPGTPTYVTSDVPALSHNPSVSSASSASPSSLSPVSSASPHVMTPPYKNYMPSPPMPMYKIDQATQYAMMPQMQKLPVATMPSTVPVVKTTTTTTKRSPSVTTGHNAVRKQSASGRVGQNVDHVSPPEQQGAKGGKVTKPKKTAHNMIEKRYRTNLNDKISALRDCVPSLRCAVGGNFDDDEEELDGLTPANKLNKATVLTKAAEYIMHLQQRNMQLQRENKALLEGKFPDQSGTMMMGGSPPVDVSMMANGAMLPGGQAVNDPSGLNRGNNMISGVGRNMMGKLMMGSMAGMMVANSFSDVDGQNSRGLAAIPIFLRSSTQSLLGPHAHAVMCVLRGTLLLGTIMYIFYPALFDGSSPSKGGKNAASSFLSSQPLAVSSPLEVRQQAWLTAIRTLNVPPRVAALEVYAVVTKIFEITLRKLIGFEGFRILFSTTAEEELGRVAAWKTAIDAQLGGGDASCSHVRLLLTLLASFLIPATPLRYMMQALQVKILFYDVPILHGVSERVQKYLWEAARRLQREQGDVVDAAEKTPDHLVNLLECDDVFDADTVTRAYNLTWNNPIDKGVTCSFRDEGLTSTIEDSAIKSPLDVLAAWYSCRQLRTALVESLDDIRNAGALAVSVKVAPPNSVVSRRALIARSVLLGDTSPQFTSEMMEAVREDLKVAASHPKKMATVPVPRPAASTVSSPERVLVAPINSSAILSSEDEAEEEEVDSGPETDNISITLSEVSSGISDDVDGSVSAGAVGTGISVVSMLSSSDTRVAIRCALVQTLLPSRPFVAEKLFSSLKVYDVSELSLLGFVAVISTVRKMQHRRTVEKTSESLIGRARIWIGGDEGEAAGIATNTRRAIVRECVQMGMRLSGCADCLETDDYEDEGYATTE